MSVFLGLPTDAAPAARCDCRRCPWYAGPDAEPGVVIAPVCSGCNSDCSYCGCARAETARTGTACSSCPIRCGSRTDIKAWMADVGETLEFDDVIVGGRLPEGLPAFIPQVDGSGAGDLDAALGWPAYAVGLRRVFSPQTHAIYPRWDQAATAAEALGLPATTLTVLSGYGEDPLVEAFWTARHRDRLLDRLATLKFDLVLAPNYSIYGNWPRAEHLINMRRSLLLTEEFVRAGMPAVPNLYWFRLEDLQRYATWIADTTPPAIAINLQTVRENKNWETWALPGLSWLAENIPAGLPVIITGLSRQDRIATAVDLFGNGLILVSQNPAQYALHGAVMTSEGRKDLQARIPDAFASSVRYLASLLPEGDD
ncbi:DUF4417 domain-containing protein [Amycolatopsis sp. EV170708-02-1]|uniref:DUF4417 domain-containing protein n=1 Tax=Amycolatopsis sp. EV170708-02-1 TaxID=2919322 RepID=UPI001F0C818F|nr:DUF4417 domain-containing protein [Amycolatopsis sp. EV170708-02-1]UMP06675.1 DUF4417 domain-containing protein [Amycolatopsis sp. EV170708-02-1]